MKLSGVGEAFLKEREDLRLTAYQDDGGVWTIGWGHTGKDVMEGLQINGARAEELFQGDVAPAEAVINELVKVPLTQPMFDALTILVFNIGRAAFRDSELLKWLNQKDYFKVPTQMCRWYYDGGNKVRGLLIRRVKEADLFCSEPFPH